jgi:hypothetical protein
VRVRWGYFLTATKVKKPKTNKAKSEKVIMHKESRKAER